MNLPGYGREWYDAVFAQPYDTDRYEALYAVFYRECNGHQSVLDLGCGTGDMLGNWPKPVPLLRQGVDWSANAIQTAQRRYPECAWRCATFDEYAHTVGGWAPAESAFRAVTLCEVLEHLTQDVALFRLAQRLAGCVVASVPNRDRCPGEAHTSFRYDEDNVRERFGPGVSIVEHDNDMTWIVFKWGA